MIARYRFLPQAREELAAAVLYYDQEFPGLGQDLAREARRLCLLVAETPLAGPELRPGIRRRLLRRFPYALPYTLEGDSVLVVAVTGCIRATPRTPNPRLSARFAGLSIRRAAVKPVPRPCRPGIRAGTLGRRGV